MSSSTSNSRIQLRNRSVRFRTGGEGRLKSVVLGRKGTDISTGETSSGTSQAGGKRRRKKANKLSFHSFLWELQCST